MCFFVVSRLWNFYCMGKTSTTLKIGCCWQIYLDVEGNDQDNSSVISEAANRAESIDVPASNSVLTIFDSDESVQTANVEVSDASHEIIHEAEVEELIDQNFIVDQKLSKLNTYIAIFYLNLIAFNFWGSNCKIPYF